MTTDTHTDISLPCHQGSMLVLQNHEQHDRLEIQTQQGHTALSILLDASGIHIQLGHTDLSIEIDEDFSLQATQGHDNTPSTTLKSAGGLHLHTDQGIHIHTQKDTGLAAKLRPFKSS